MAHEKNISLMSNTDGTPVFKKVTLNEVSNIKTYNWIIVAGRQNWQNGNSQEENALKLSKVLTHGLPMYDILGMQ